MHRPRLRILTVALCAVALTAFRADAFQLDLTRHKGTLRDGTAPFDVASDSDGNAVVVGRVGSIFAVDKISSQSARRVWSHWLPGGGATAVTVDSAGNPIVAGGLDVGGNSYAVVLKLSPDTGAETWRSLFPAPSGADVQNLVSDPGGDVVVSSHDVGIRRLAGASGAEIWQRDLGAIAVRDISLRGSEVVVSGNNGDWVVIKSSAVDGSEMWRQAVGGATGVGAQAARLDGNGDVLTLGSVAEGNPSTWYHDVAKLAGLTGAEIWRARVGEAQSGPFSMRALALAPNGDAVVSAELYIAFDLRIAVTRLAGADGSSVWRTEYPTAHATIGGAEHIAIDGNGDVIVIMLDDAGENSVFVAKLDGSTGAEIWHAVINGRRLPTSRDEYGALALDPAGNPFVFSGLQSLPTASPYVLSESLTKLTNIDGGDLLPGKRLAMRSDTGGTRLVLRARDGVNFSPETEADPTAAGALLEVRNPATGETVSVPLPAGAWQATNTSGLHRDLHYNDPGGACDKILLRPRLLHIRCPAIAFSLDEASQGSIAVRLTTGTGTGARRYCLLFGGTTVRDVPGAFEARDADVPAACPFP